MRALVNRNVRPGELRRPSGDALAYHRSLPAYEPTPLRPLPRVAHDVGVAAVAVKDESARLGLNAFKVLGASWAVERALRDDPRVHTLVAASAGNHGRAVAHVAALRGLRCRVYLPARASAARRELIAAKGADVVVVEGSYEDAVARAAADGALSGWLELADVGTSGPAHWVIDGYATLFAEVAAAGERFDLILVPVGVGSLAAAAARFGAHAGARVVVVEPVTAACLTASLAVNEPTPVPTPGTTMAGLDAAEVSVAAWPTLRTGIAGTVVVSDDEAQAAIAELAAAGLTIGDCGAATLAALRALASEPECAELRRVVGVGPHTRALLIATEGATDPAAYEAALARARA